jgi:uncharacterized protein
MSDNGSFCWYELSTSDVAGAAAFYADVFGWRVEDAGVPGVDYRLFKAGERGVGGLMATMEGGPGPSWLGYVNVDDADAIAAEAKSGGATIHRGPADIPGVGRFGIMSDPQGALLAFIQVVPPPPGAPRNLPAGWHELHTSDHDAALAFHTGLWGWEKGRAMDMGPNGIYQMISRDGIDLGATFTSAEEPPHWLFYFDVAGLDAAMERVRAGGGAILHGPHEVPTTQWIALCRDPFGAGFAMVSDTR